MTDEDSATTDHPIDEARFWGERQTSEVPDHRLRVRTSSPDELWEDPEVEAIARGGYVDRILASCSTPGLDALELACGCGWLSLEMARRGVNVEGIDLSPMRIGSAKDYALTVREREAGLGRIEYQVADLTTFALPRSRYDRIVCWDGLHHIAPIDPLMRRIHEGLRPGGLFLLFDHIGPASRVQALLDRAAAGFVIAIFQPNCLGRILKGRGKKPRAPSEDATGVEMVHAAIRFFGADNVRVETTMGFGKRWLARLRGPRRARLALVHGLCALDRFWIRAGILRGEYVFLVAVKPESGGTGDTA